MKLIVAVASVGHELDNELHNLLCSFLVFQVSSFSSVRRKTRLTPFKKFTSTLKKCPKSKQHKAKINCVRHQVPITTSRLRCDVKVEIFRE